MLASPGLHFSGRPPRGSVMNSILHASPPSCFSYHETGPADLQRPFLLNIPDFTYSLNKLLSRHARFCSIHHRSLFRNNQVITSLRLLLWEGNKRVEHLGALKASPSCRGVCCEWQAQLRPLRSSAGETLSELTSGQGLAAGRLACCCL